MSLWTQRPDLLVLLLILGASLTAFSLSGRLDDNDDGQAWGDDPHVIAMLCGMSL